MPSPTPLTGWLWLSSQGGSTQPRRSQGRGAQDDHDAAEAPSQATLLALGPSHLAHSWGYQTGRSLTWSNTWLLVALYFCAMASATALGPMNSVFQL